MLQRATAGTYNHVGTARDAARQQALATGRAYAVVASRNGWGYEIKRATWCRVTDVVYAMCSPLALVSVTSFAQGRYT